MHIYTLYINIYIHQVLLYCIIQVYRKYNIGNGNPGEFKCGIQAISVATIACTYIHVYVCTCNTQYTQTHSMSK